MTKGVSYRVDYTFAHRDAESKKLIEKYPDRIPAIVEKALEVGLTSWTLTKKKYLVPKDLTVGQFMSVLRNRMNLPFEQAIRLCIDKVKPATSDRVDVVYQNYKDKDGFVYFTYSFAEVIVSDDTWLVVDGESIPSEDIASDPWILVRDDPVTVKN